MCIYPKTGLQSLSRIRQRWEGSPWQRGSQESIRREEGGKREETRRGRSLWWKSSGRGRRQRCKIRRGGQTSERLQHQRRAQCLQKGLDKKNH